MSKPKVNIALIGYRFMGRTHSNAYRQAKAFYDLPVEPVLRVLCGRNTAAAAPVAAAFGWQEVMADWQEVVQRPDIDVVDISTPGYTHHDIAVAAVRAGKAVICEKPLGNSLAEAQEMAQAAQAAGVPNLCNFNYRWTPAVALAHQLISDGALGVLRHWRSTYLQGWLANPQFPLTWRLRKETAGAGALGDIGSHSLDLARFLVGEVQAVCGMTKTFITERPLPAADQGRASVAGEGRGAVTVDDATWTLLRFVNGAMGSAEATRMAPGRFNYNCFEINGSRGSLSFDLERLNELQYFSLDDPRATQGWRTIHVTAPEHPHMAAWWPAGHSIGYEHTFTHAIVDFLQSYAEGRSPRSDFRSAAQTQAVMEAVLCSAAGGAWV
ncbi:MAG: Gfo/Idh/MocA family oxidoreductase, partial [Chloroflexi bacterium]|nr:Gfo/Idh/MocA family oxidoreductase [Chloroflexota bacterium]